uniref:Multiple C2 and transmembrane domain containing 1 n=1 Tax=Oncorhynchus kisutch TaxID=8019 RepID=A0A8C7CDP7_ONCKI
MEDNPKDDSATKGQESISYQRRMWKNFQDKTKPFLSPKLGSGRRSPDSKKETGLWMFKRKKKELDRFFSSSQPNLCCSTPAPFLADQSLGGTAPGSSSTGQPLHQLLGADGASVSKPELTGHDSPKLIVSHLILSHQKSSSLGSACFEKLVVESSVVGEEEQLRKNHLAFSQHKAPLSSQFHSNLFSPNTYPLSLWKGHPNAFFPLCWSLFSGTSDPYVKFKIAGKEVFRSRTINKNLNPVWDERVSLLVDSLREPLYVKVFDYDFGLQDDFMGSAYLYLESLEHQRTLDVTLDLEDPQYPEHNLGTLELAVTLSPKEGDFREATMHLKRSCKRSSKQQHSSMRLSDVHKKAQLWRGIVSISLIEAHDLQPMDANGFSDPYVKFRLGHQKYKSKTIPKTLNPQWREQFDFHLYEEQGGFIDITVWDKDAGKKDDFMGRCSIDLSPLSKEHTHKFDLPLEEGEGMLVLLVTLTGAAAVSISDLSVNILDDTHERHQIRQRYSVLRSFHNLKDVGVVQVKVIRSEGLMAADVTGKSDPFCVVELSNDRLQTHTVYKNLNPEWNKVFTFNVKDIHSVLEVTVYDEDRDRSADFLGKVAIPLLNIQNGERKAYALKSKELTGPTKGVIFLEIDVIFNAVKAGFMTLIPKEQKYIEDEPRVSKQLLLQNFNRVRRCILFLINAGCYINSCFEWDSTQRSICSFLVLMSLFWWCGTLKLYMIPLVLLLPLAWNYILISSGKDTRQDVVSVPVIVYVSHDPERKGFINKLYAIQDVCISVQNALDEVASYGERIKNTFNWTVPFLSWLAIVALCVATVLIYYIPLRYIVLAWGVNKFSKKLRDPYTIDNNELLDFLSRVPSDVQVVAPTHSPLIACWPPPL